MHAWTPLVVPLFLAKLDKIKSRIKSKWPHLADLDVAYLAKYLGLWFGPKDAKEASWRKPLLKFAQRCDIAGSLNSGATLTIAGANIYGYSTLSFVAQVREPTEEMIKLSKHCNRKLLGGPYHWLPDSLAGVMQSHLYLANAPLTIVDYCLAIRLRVICSNTLDWKASCNKLDQARILMNARSGTADERSCISLAVGNPWEREICCRVLERAANEGTARGLIEQVNGKWSVCKFETFVKCASDQTKILKQLAVLRFGKPGESNELVVKELVARTSRWSETKKEAHKDASRVLHLLAHTAHSLPACLRFGFLQSICYGWLTDQRFKVLPPRACVFCCGIRSGNDDFYHYAQCPVVWNVLHELKLRPSTLNFNNIRWFLVLEDDSHIPLRIAFLHSCMVSVHQLRHHSNNTAYDLRKRYLQTNFRRYVGKDRSLVSSLHAL